MTDLRQAAQQALEAMDKATRFMSDSDYKKLNQAIDDLRAALAEPEQKVWCACGDSIEPDTGAKCGNCVAADSAEPEQEPVAWDACRSEKQCQIWCGNSACVSHWNYTAPTPRKPLTDEEIDAAQDAAEKSFVAMNKGLTPRPLSERAAHFDWHLARAIEAAHGITGETK